MRLSKSSLTANLIANILNIKLSIHAWPILNNTIQTLKTNKSAPLTSSFKITFLSLTIMLFAFLSHSNLYADEIKKDMHNIAISQIVEHPALDAVRLSMLKALDNEGFTSGKNLTVLYENAQGNMITSTQIASKILSSPIDLAIGISTPSAQSLFFEAKKQGKTIPIVYSAVSDPIAAQLDSHIYPITGITDTAHLEGLLELMQKLLPKLKTLGLMYNPAETNSVSTINRLKVLLKAKNIQVVEVTVTKTQDVAQATKSLVGKVDALYFPQDNTIVAAIETVVSIANQASPTLPVILPIFSSDPQLIKKGVLAAVGYDYEDVGKETGIMVAKILKGTAIQDLPPHNPATLKALINKPLAEKMGLIVPTSLEFAKVELFTK